MDDSKRKKSKANRKKNDSLIRSRKSVKKKTKKKANLRNINATFISGAHLFSQFRRPGVEKLQVKGKQGSEGMFFKGLRSEYITRESLNEANEARKNEDINKIIDIGRVFLKKQRSDQSTSRNKNPKLEKSPVFFRKTSDNMIEDLGECLLSPISFASSIVLPLRKDDSRIDSPIKNKKLNLEKEFEMFSSRYEQTVCARILLRLPDDGVLEDAIEAISKKRNKNKSQEFLPGDEFLKEFESLKENLPDQIATEEGFIEKFFIHETPTQEEENTLIMADVQSENCNHPSLIPFHHHDVENVNVLEFRQDFTKNLSIPTPPLQFYRRNMF